MSTKTLSVDDWRRLAENAASYVTTVCVDTIETRKKIVDELSTLRESVGWCWDTYEDADGNIKAIYWDGATADEREMLDLAATYGYMHTAIVNKLRQASDLLLECDSLLTLFNLSL